MKNIDRRNFIKTSSLATLGTLVASSSFASVIGDKGIILIVAMPEDVVANSEPATGRLANLEQHLKNKEQLFISTIALKMLTGFVYW